MKSILLILLAICHATPVFGCNWSTGITKTKDGNYSYTPECHAEVGKTVQNLRDREEQVERYKKLIELKDLALERSEERTILWQNESYKQYEFLQKQNFWTQQNDKINFALGFGAAILGVWAAGQLN